MKHKLFGALTLLFIISWAGWHYYFSVYQQTVLDKAETELENIVDKVDRAALAKNNYQEMTNKYSEQSALLASVKSKFIKKTEISKVTGSLKVFARKYNVKLLDFSPAFDKYFNVKDHEKISLLPIELSFQGRYLSIGAFLENWSKLPFYLTHNELVLRRVDEKQNDLLAEVTASLYIWDE